MNPYHAPAPASGTSQIAPSQSPAQSRRVSARQMLAAARIRESLGLASPPPLRNAAVAGLQTALAVLIAVAATHLSPWAQFAGFPALGALAALFGRFAPARRRMTIVTTSGLLLVASIGLLSLASWAGATPAAALLCLALLAGLLTIGAARWQLGAPGVVIFVFAASAGLHPVDTGQSVAARAIFAAAGAAIAWLVCLLTDGLRSSAAASDSAAAEAAQPMRHQLTAAARIAFGAALAALLALAAGWSHPAWAAIGATAVLQGSHLHITMHRAIQRTVGTVIGAAIAWLILGSQPSFWLVLLAVALLQFITELVIGFNYVFGQICITPMALLMTSLTASPASAAGMPLDRVLDTALGALIGVAFALVFSSLDDRARLAAHHADHARAHPAPPTNRPLTDRT